MSQPKLSIIIPCLNEASNIERLLKELQQQKNIISEIIVVDGGSQDGTQNIAKNAGVVLLETKRGRGHQMNEGAKIAQYEMLFFIHADSYIESDSLLYKGMLELQSSSGSQIAGHFSLRFIRNTKRKSLAYFHYEEKSKLNREETFGGDQGLFIDKSFFEELGEFDESLPFLEDKKISLEILKQGKFVTLSGCLGTSIRRFEVEGFSRRMLLTILIIGLNRISYHMFFEHAFDLYKEQDKSLKLNMHSFFYLIHQINMRNSLKTNFLDWYRVGRYTRGNIWQFFFFGDVCLRYFFKVQRTPFLSFHDGVFPFTNFWLFDLIVMILTYTIFYICWVYFWFTDRVFLNKS